MKIQAIHSLDFCFGFYFIFNCGDLYCTQTTYIELIFESKKSFNSLIFLDQKQI